VAEFFVRKTCFLKTPLQKVFEPLRKSVSYPNCCRNPVAALENQNHRIAILDLTFVACSAEPMSRRHSVTIL
jgi:hypothetical protein